MLFVEQLSEVWPGGWKSASRINS